MDSIDSFAPTGGRPSSKNSRIDKQGRQQTTLRGPRNRVAGCLTVIIIIMIITRLLMRSSLFFRSVGLGGCSYNPTIPLETSLGRNRTMGFVVLCRQQRSKAVPIHRRERCSASPARGFSTVDWTLANVGTRVFPFSNTTIR